MSLSGSTNTTNSEPAHKDFESRTIEILDRFVPHQDPEFLEKLLVTARRWIVESGMRSGLGIDDA